MGAQVNNNIRRTLLVICCLLLAVGNCGGPLMMRLYFVKGGSRTWLSAWLLTGGWPLILILLTISYFYRRKTEGPNTKLILMKLPVFIAAVMIGVLLGAMNYSSGFAVARLPVSTATLINSTSLVFTAVFAFFLVKQKFTGYSINAVVLLIIGAVVLGLHAGSDRPKGESHKSYILGFIMMFVSTALLGIIMPLIEMVYKNAKQEITYPLVMEFQMVMCLTATVIATIGMLVNNDFKAIPREAREYQLGEAKYYVVLVWNAIIWQFFNWGTVGIVFCASALVSGILIAVLLPVSQVLAVIFFHDKFQAEKGVALALCLWGFVSYFYGEIKERKKRQIQIQIQESEMTPSAAP